MELRELGNRLFRLHARLIIICLVAGVIGGLTLALQDKPEHQASVLFTMGSPDPPSAEVATVLADTARGIATGPELVGQAIAKAGASRDEKAVAAAISIQTMGSSGVVMLSVTDRAPGMAVRLANALASAVVSTRAQLIQNSKASSIQGLDQQEASTQAQIRQVNAQIEQLSAQESPLAIAKLSALEGRLTSLQDLATQIAVQRNNLQSQLGPQPKVIDKAASAVGVHGRQLDNALLGGLVGLVLGIAIAAGREVMRPSLVGPMAVSRAIGAPLLGEMNTSPDTWTLASLPNAGSYIELAANAKDVQEVRFAALDPRRGRRWATVRMLEGPLQRLRFSWSRSAPSTVAADDDLLAGPGSAAGVIAVSGDDQNGKSSPRIGLVVAVPRVLKQADIDPLVNFIWISDWVLLGVITCPPPRKAMKAAQRNSGSADPGHHSSVTQQAEVDAW
jgi:capsular polysaccharide biosynthesis protein